MEDVIGQLTGIAPFVMIVLIVWFEIQKKMNQSRIRAELQKEVLAKFSSGQELNEFLNTDAGRRLMQEPPASKYGSKRRVIALAVGGIIAVGAGVGFYFGGEDLEAVGLFTGGGLALLASAGVSYWLAKKLGLSDTPGDFLSL